MTSPQVPGIEVREITFAEANALLRASARACALLIARNPVPHVKTDKVVKQSGPAPQWSLA